MKRLNHPNIIQFIEVYEDMDHLMMVMEYCPGNELFDVILARRFFNEDDARPIFAQICRALYYLHSLNIIHRDVKPENVLISNIINPATGEAVAKLLDFGLSKNAAAGSAAKTFVGTPCYLAPEVEYTAKGLGGTYGLPADCWSLGAVLYVMLVARFPEFEQDYTGKVVVKLPPALFNNISSEAKDLIRSLMNTNPAARLTMAGALMHPWLGKYRATHEELTRVAVANSDLNHHLQEEEDMIESQHQLSQLSQSTATNPELTAGGAVVHHQAMVIRQNDVSRPNPHPHTQQNFGPEQLQLAPLLHLQRSIAVCFEEAHAQYQDFPEVAAQVRRGAMLCRQQLVESTKMLRKVEQTAKEVLNMFPDLELAVEEEEPKLAAEFFGIVKGWVVELREQVNSTQKINKASMNQIQRVVEQSSINLREHENRKKNNDHVSIPIKMLESLLSKLNVQDSGRRLTYDSAGSVRNDNNNDNDVSLDASQVLELFMAMFSSQYKIQQQQQQVHPPSSHHLQNPVESNDELDMMAVTDMSPRSRAQQDTFSMADIDEGDRSFPVPQQPHHLHHQPSPPQAVVPHVKTESHHHDVSQPLPVMNGVENTSNISDNHQALVTHTHNGPSTSDNTTLTQFLPADGTSSPKAAKKLAEALQKLRKVSSFLIVP
jgi:serine/threonine protein kinase